MANKTPQRSKHSARPAKTAAPRAEEHIHTVKSEKRRSEKREARSEKREARSEKREARSEKREARSEKREASSEKREARSEKRDSPSTPPLQSTGQKHYFRLSA